MKKFTQAPIGLGFYCSEHETSIAYIWNELVDKQLPPNSLWECTPIRLHNIQWANDGVTLLSMGAVIREGDMYKLSDWAIEKINKYFEVYE